MKNQRSPDDDASLRAVLKEWQPNAALPPRFQEQVWRRIERAEAASPSRFSPAAVATWITNLLMKPAPATVCVVALLVAGAGAGWELARHYTERIHSELGARYAKVVDPYQAIPRR